MVTPHSSHGTPNPTWWPPRCSGTCPRVLCIQKPYKPPQNSTNHCQARGNPSYKWGFWSGYPSTTAPHPPPAPKGAVSSPSPSAPCPGKMLLPLDCFQALADRWHLGPNLGWICPTNGLNAPTWAPGPPPGVNTLQLGDLQPLAAVLCARSPSQQRNTSTRSVCTVLRGCSHLCHEEKAKNPKPSTWKFPFSPIAVIFLPSAPPVSRVFGGTAAGDAPSPLLSSKERVWKPFLGGVRRGQRGPVCLGDTGLCPAPAGAPPAAPGARCCRAQPWGSPGTGTPCPPPPGCYV